MRALILADRSFSIRERALLARLEVGLADEGVRVLHGVPRSAASQEPGAPAGELFAQRIVYEDRGPRLFRRARARQLVAELMRGQDASPGVVADVVHVFGEGAWELGAEVATLLRAGLALEVWRPDLAAPAARVRTGGATRGERAGTPVVLFAASPAIESRLRAEAEHAGGAAVRASTWGVHTPAHPHDLLAPGRVPSILLVGSGRDAPAVAAALQGVAGLHGLAALAAAPEPLVFADADMCRRAGAWPIVRRAGIADRFTLVPDVEARRELTLRSDLVLLPETLGEQRSFALDAMAAGVIVVGTPATPCLLEGRTGRVVERPAPDRWTAVIGSVLTDPDAAAALASSAREYTRSSLRATTHVGAVMDAYEWMTAGDTLPFREPVRR